MSTTGHPLETRVQQSLLTRYEALRESGELLSKERLSEFYALFRNRFGPEKLKTLDGEALLNTIHGRGGKDSLVHWLEFKNDTEFPTGAFGSIKGGNSLKFGIAKKKDTGEWTTGNAINPKILTVDEAVTIARGHRDQLLAAVAALRELPTGADDKTYLALQNELSQAARDVYDVAWGHKYLYLLFPDKLDDYHVDLWQRHHLLKLLLLPASKSGLFTCAGQFVRVANQLGWPMNHLTAVLNERDGNPINYWRIGTKLGEGPDAQDVWPDMKAGGYAAIGWAELGDLSSLMDEKDAKEKIAGMLIKEYSSYNPSTASRKAGEVRNFAREMSERDIVLAADGSRIRGVGLVEGPYRYETTSPEGAPHRRKVEWHDCAEWKSPVNEGLRTTVCRLKDDDTTLVEAEKHLLEPMNTLAAPFNQFFASFEEANHAFNLLADTLKQLGVDPAEYPKDNRICLSLAGEKKKDDSLRLNVGDWAILTFKNLSAGENRIEFLCRADQVPATAQYLGEKSHFSEQVDGHPFCLALCTPSAIRNPASEERKAFDTSLSATAKRFGASRWPTNHEPALLRMVYDLAYRHELLNNGLGSAKKDAGHVQPDPSQRPPALNTILYGPPGTGKTYHLRNTYMDMFTDRRAALTPEETASALVEDLPWWQVAALALLDTKDHKATVVQLLEHPLVRARLKLSSNKNPPSMLWAALQIHTKEECVNVKYSSRTPPLIFEKDNAAVWSVDASLVATILPRLTQLVQQYQHPANAGDVIQKRFEFVTFHQSFSYEDFIEGIKPDLADAESEAPDGHISYRVKPGIFKRVCAAAAACHPKPYALFIDEINRGNVANIFGELITLIEEDKRKGAKNELTAKLPYSEPTEAPFSVPNNLYIIGTMNTADRSVEALDTALRRRFVFVEMKPDKNLIPKPPGLNVDLPKLFEVINARLETLLDHDHCIGHAYFMDVKDLLDLKRVFANKIIPLLREYFYGNPAKIGLVIGDRFVSQKTEATKFAAGDWGLDGLDEKAIFHFTDQSAWKEEDFASIYA